MLSTSSRQSIGCAPTAPFNVPLPRELREEIDAVSSSIYAPSTGPLRLGNWRCTDADRPATRLGPQARHYQATIAVGDRITTATAAASGPIAALTEMLHERGIVVEMLKFHQRHTDDGTATFIRGSDGVRAEWAMGLSEDATQSALRAMISCANRLHAERS